MTWRIESPLGALALETQGDAIVRLDFVEDCDAPAPQEGVALEAARQLAAYFEGGLRAFDLPVRPQGTEFQQRVWSALQGIPYGKTRSYLDLARQLGDANATRAVGAANGQNPIAIFIPCHRVIGTNGKLTGYAGGLERKRRLLELEGALARTLWT